MTQPTNEPRAPKDKLTVEALRFYVPVFQAADDFYEEHSQNVTMENRNAVDTALSLREMAVDQLMSLARPLIIRELNKILSGSHIKKDDDSIFDLLYYAGRGGAIRGLRHFDVEKLDVSATNYLFQWITTYAKKELTALEAAPFGIPPARFTIYKKISAVRKKLSEKLERYATNDEVLAAFHSGEADVKTMNGRKKKADSSEPSNPNRKMTMELVEEQEYFERNLISQNLVDPLDQQANKALQTEHSNDTFRESFFGTFLDSYPFTIEARVALMSELQVEPTKEELAVLEGLTPLELKRLSFKWKALLKDKNGPFAEFLHSVQADGFTDFDVARTLRALSEYPDVVKRATWAPLLTTGDK